MGIVISDQQFKLMTERIEEQSHYIKELEKANEYKDRVIAELNEKYTRNEPSIKEVVYGEQDG